MPAGAATGRLPVHTRRALLHRAVQRGIIENGLGRRVGNGRHVRPARRIGVKCTLICDCRCPKIAVQPGFGGVYQVFGGLRAKLAYNHLINRFQLKQKSVQAFIFERLNTFGYLSLVSGQLSLVDGG